MPIETPSTAHCKPDLPTSAWELLFKQIWLDDPDVIVLVARKMPRLAEVFKLRFSARSTVIADIALPFSWTVLKGARVAIVDDVVNVGTTVYRAASIAKKAGALAVKTYSLGKRSDDQLYRNEFASYFAVERPLSRTEYRGHVRSIPAAISNLAKPFDLAFPVISCGYPFGIDSADGIISKLEKVFHKDQLQIIPSPYHNSPVQRLTIWADENSQRKDRKLRIYFDDQLRVCRLVPIAIQQPISLNLSEEKELLSTWGALIKQVEQFVELPESAKKDAFATIKVFKDSLIWFECHVAAKIIGPVLRRISSLPFDVSEASLLFGPLANQVAETHSGRNYKVSQRIKKDDSLQVGQPPSTSPFVDKFNIDLLLEFAKENMVKECPEHGWKVFDIFSGVKAILDALANMIGADDANNYSQNWPFTISEVRADPYLRLRIGPTFGDLVYLVTLLAQRCGYQKINAIERAISLVIDMSVDQGSIVPTYAHFENMSFRIYRRGEQNQYRRALFRAQLAWHESGIPMSLTRFSKLLAIMGHSKEFCEGIDVGAATRGTVALLRPELSGGEKVEYSHHLRDTGRLKEVDS